MTVRLNLGSGSERLPEGWVHIDRAFPSDTPEIVSWHGYPRVEIEGVPAIVLDFAKEPLPYDDGTVDYAVAHHVLDLLTADEMKSLLGEIFRVLKPGGVLRVSCADLSRGVEAAIADDTSFFPEVHEDDQAGGPDMMSTVGWFITQGGARKQYLTCDRFRDACEGAGLHWFPANAGYGTAEIMELDSRQEESWFAEALK